jgi:hypothetical protein
MPLRSETNPRNLPDSGPFFFSAGNDKPSRILDVRSVVSCVGMPKKLQPERVSGYLI